MKKLIFLIAALLLSLALCVAQPAPRLTFTVASDTSFLEFDQVPRLSVSKRTSGRNVYFQMNRKDFKSLAATVGFLQTNYDLCQSSLEASRKIIAKNDSIISILKLKYETEAERVTNLMKGYEDLKVATQAQQDQLNKCVTDMKSLNKARKREKRKGFLHGVLIGLAAGVVGGVLVGAGS